MISFFKCNKCGNVIVKVVEKSESIDCCEEPMKKLIPGEIDAASEKHVPVIIKENDKITVNIGEVFHPMEEKHYISFILIETASGFQIKYLNYKDEPKATFIVDEDIIAVYEYCTLHGLWKKEL